MIDPDVAKIARGLTKAQQDILRAVCDGQRLLHATRAQDSFRQQMRRKGLIHVVKNPRRWEPLPLGLRVRQYLEQSQ